MSLKTSDNTTSSCSSCSSAVPVGSNSIELMDERPAPKVYRDFSNKAHSLAYLNRVPSTGTIEILENCNFRCIHCYQGMNKSRKKLSAEKWCSIIDELADAGTFWLLITGGEPMLHPEFEKIYTHAYRKGFIVTVFTNARTIKDEHLELFKKYPPFAVEVSLYGASEDMYQQVTGTKGSFQLVKKNLRRMMEAKLIVKCKSVAFKPLHTDMAAMQDYVENELGLTFRFDTKIDPSIYGDQLDDIRLSAEEVVRMEEALVGRENLASDMAALFDINKKAIKAKKSGKDLYRCGAGKNSFYIDYKGFVHTCSVGRLEKEKIDLNEMSFQEAWMVQLPKVIFQERKNLDTVCMKCEYREICDACPATAKLATGSKEGRPQYVCQITMERKKRYLIGDANGKKEEKEIREARS